MTDAPLHDWSCLEIAAAVQRGDVSAEEVTRHHLERIEARADLNAFITVTAEQALADARALPEHRRTGPLAGVPFAPKDLFDVAGVVTTAGGTHLRDNVATSTAWSVQRLVDAGAIVVGKTNLSEYAWGVTSQNVHYGFVQNPRHPGRIAGGSSGGSAAGLAAGMRIEPPVSVPSVSANSPAARPAADPPDDPPAIRPGWRGFCTNP
jgi:Asp-tRNA(Asn)/Glu-tRNA(Gln) amidotransferase A subunit family amidase